MLAAVEDKAWAFAARSEKTGQTALKPEGDSARLQAGDALSEGTAVRGDENDAVDGDVGQYINLAIDFSYDGRKNRKGWDLHFLIFMGIGIKGLAGFEVPTWVTMLKITGTVRLADFPCVIYKLNPCITGPYKAAAQSRCSVRANGDDLAANYPRIRLRGETHQGLCTRCRRTAPGQTIQ